MSGFEFLFSFYGLLLGLAVANIASGFADAWRRRGDWKMGVAPLLLGLFILLAAAQQWTSFWRSRDGLTMGPSELLMSLGMALPYIFVSHVMFPVELKEGRSLEDHYFEQQRVLMAALLMPALLSMLYNIVISPPLGILNAVSFVVLGYGPRIGIPIVLMLRHDRPVHWIGLTLLSVWMLLLMFF